MRTCALVTCLAFTLLTVGPASAQGTAPAPAEDDPALREARQHFETGRNAYNAGDYVTAIREFKAAEQLRPSPILAYNIGLANEKLGKRRVAVKYYRRYLDQQPNAPNRPEVDQRIQQLEADIAANPNPPGQPGPPGQPTTPTAEQPSDMPPTDGQSGSYSQPGYYDPYTSRPPPGQPVPLKKPKKRSLWWVGLIVAGAVTVTVAIIIYAYFATQTVYYDTPRALENNPGPGRIPASTGGGLTLFRF